MNVIFAAAWEIEQVCQRAHLAFCFIGGLAVQRWGEPRMTADVDMTLLTGFGTEERFVDEILRSFVGRIPDARDFALRNRVLLIKASNGISLDVSLGAMPFEERCVARATAFSIGSGLALTTCSAEDLLVSKAFAGRDKDWVDIRGILIRQGGALDANLVWDELLPLLELRADTATEPRLRKLFEEVVSRHT